MLSADESWLMEMEEQTENITEEIPSIITSDESPSGISMHAFEGHLNPSTFKLEGFIKSQTISILVDLGSTHNFIQIETAIRLKLVIHAIKPFTVATSGEEKIICDKMCKNVEIKIQGVIVCMDIFLIKMSGSNVVIGIQWLKKVGNILSNYDNMKMSFTWENKEITWKDLEWISNEPLISGELKSLYASTREAYLCYYETVEKTPVKQKTLKEEQPQIHKVVQQFNNIFADPYELPPVREQDHRFLLSLDNQPVNVRPYMYRSPI